jgi:hypothetical protein
LVSDDYTAEARSPAGPDFGDEDPLEAGHDVRRNDMHSAGGADFSPDAAVDRVRPFAALNPLPDDLATACESFQLAILRHKAQHWAEVTLDDVLASLDALKALALAPS